MEQEKVKVERDTWHDWFSKIQAAFASNEVYMLMKIEPDPNRPNANVLKLISAATDKDSLSITTDMLPTPAQPPEYMG